MRVNVNVLKEKEKDLGEEFQQIAGVKSELRKYGLEIDDLESFAKTVKEAVDLGFDAHLIGSKLRYWDELKKKEIDLAESVLTLGRKKELLEHQVGYEEAK